MRLSLLLFTLLTLPFTADAQSNDWSTVIRSSLAIDSGVVQSLTLSEDPTSGEVSTSVEVEPGVVLSLVLRKHSNRADDFQLLVDQGDGVLVPVPAPPIETYRGDVPGSPEMQVRASIRAGQLRGIIFGPSVSYAIQPTTDVLTTAPAEQHVAYATDAWSPTNAWCAVPSTSQAAPGGGAGPASGPTPGLQIAEIALEADFEYYELCNSSIVDTMVDMEDILNSVNGIYEAQVGITHELGQVIVRTAPLYTSTDPNGRVNQFASQWSTPPESSIQRDVAHLFTGQTLTGGALGNAVISVICTNSSYGLSVDKSPASYAGRVAVPAHELGHNWSALHCNGDPECWIMCAELAGCGPITEFAPSAVSSITAFRDTRPCLTTEIDPQPLPFFETWEELAFEETRWSFNFGVGVTSASTAEPTLPFVLRLNTVGSSEISDDELRTVRLALAGLNDVTFQYYVRASGVDLGNQLITEYRAPNLDWIELDVVTSDGVDPEQFEVRTVTLPAEAHHDGCRIRFRAEVDVPSEDWYVDNISITDGPPPPLPIPNVTFVTPSTGPLAGGTELTLLGENFLPDSTVLIGGTPATDLVYVDHSEIRVTSPASPSAGPVDVSAANDSTSGVLPGAYTYSDNSVSLSAEQVSPGGSVTVTTFASNDVVLAGFSLACAFDGTWIDVDTVSLDGTGLETADFVAPNTSNDPGDSWWTLGVAFDLAPPVDLLLPIGVDHEIAFVTFSADPAAPIGEQSALVLASGVGDPPVDVVFSTDMGTGTVPSTSNGLIQIDDVGFIRGDGNGDGAVDIADPVANLSYQFQSGPAGCFDALDVNDDGTIDIADPVYNLNFQFAMGPPPSPPFPDPGTDPTPDSLGCQP